MVTWLPPRLSVYITGARSAVIIAVDHLANHFHSQAKIWLKPKYKGEFFFFWNAGPSWPTVWTGVYVVFSHCLSIASTALAFGVGVTNMYEIVCWVVTEDTWVYIEQRNHHFHSTCHFLLSVSVSSASLWRRHGNRTSSFLKASVYPDHTTTRTQRFHIYSPQRSFFKASFSVSEFQVLMWTEGLNR